jgi:hypothetical protein
MKNLSLLGALVIMVCCLGFYIFKGRELASEVDVPLYQAQIATNRNEMITHLTTLKKALEKNHMTTGNFELWSPTLTSDLSIYYQTVTKTLNRLANTEATAQDNQSEQLVIEASRQTIKGLKPPGYPMATTRYWLIMAFGIFIWMWPLAVYINNSER